MLDHEDAIIADIMHSTGNDLMQIQQLAAEAVPGRLDSSAAGISAAEAVQRLRRHGPNRIEKLARVPWGLRPLGAFVQFFSVILWIAAALAFYLGVERSGAGHGADRLCPYRGDPGQRVLFWQEYRVEQTLNARQKLLPPQVSVLRG